MVENRKLFYAISLMLLTCCQIITMLPHNIASNESSGESSADNSEMNNKSAMLMHDKSNRKGNNSQDNNNDDSDSLIIAAERVQHHYQQQHTIVSDEAMWETQENNSRPTDNIDDLIFLDKRPINQHRQYEKHQQQQHTHPHSQHHQLNEKNHSEFHHITTDGSNSNISRNINSNSNSNSNSDESTDSLTYTTYSSMMAFDEDNVDNNDGVNDGAPHEIELQPSNSDEVTSLNVTPLDLSDFLSLIPAAEVKTIVNHYYQNDPEVQRAHAYMSSRDFSMLKQHIITVPEMSAFLRYLNNSGLDLAKFVTALTNLTSYTTEDSITTSSSADELSSAAAATEYAATNITETNYIEYAQKQRDTIEPTISNAEIQIKTTSNNLPTATKASPETTLNGVKTTATTRASKEQLNGLHGSVNGVGVETTATTIAPKEQLHGLHGLVDSILDVLPQDQILATFFDKLESNEQFSILVDKIGSPEFAKILNNLQNSSALKNFIFRLHNNGIYVMRIVDSLKSYFFLGGF